MVVGQIDLAVTMKCDIEKHVSGRRHLGMGNPTKWNPLNWCLSDYYSVRPV